MITFIIVMLAISLLIFVMLALRVKLVIPDPIGYALTIAYIVAIIFAAQLY